MRMLLHQGDALTVHLLYVCVSLLFSDHLTVDAIQAASEILWTDVTHSLFV